MNRSQAPGEPRQPRCRVETDAGRPATGSGEPQVEEVQPAPMPEVELPPAPAPVIFRQQQEVRSAIEPVRSAGSVRRPAPAAVGRSPRAARPRGSEQAQPRQKQPLGFSNPLGFVGSVRAGWSGSAPMRTCGRASRLVALGQACYPAHEEASRGGRPTSVAARTARFITGCRSEPLHRPIPKCFASG